MKRIFTTLVAVFGMSQFSFAQWNTTVPGKITTTDNVGIGTTTPANLIHLKSSTPAIWLEKTGILNWQVGNLTGNNFTITPDSYGGSAFNINAGGNVGIGATNPSQKLDVAGNVLVRGTGSYANNPGVGEFQLGYGLAAAGTSGTVTRLAIQPYGHTGGPWKFDARDVSGTANLDIYYGGSGVGSGLTLDHTGNLSLGTIDGKGYKLAVNGSAIATSMTVKLHANWPDFVFKKDYKLPTLTAVKNYIDQNQHLPDMPSADEVHTNGLDLGEMNRLLTKKVEELTLYLIEKDKQLIEQQGQLTDQQTLLKTLEKRLTNLESQNKK